MDYVELFGKVQKLPGMYLTGKTYNEAIGFINGVDAGNDWMLLCGFQEWMEMRRPRRESNLHWSAHVLRIALPESPDAWSSRTVEEERRAIVQLFELVIGFLNERERSGAQEVFQNYFRWRDGIESSGPTETG